MSFAQPYFSKHHFLMPQITTPPPRGLSFIVVIPAYLEKDITQTLLSLKNTVPVQGVTEVLIIVNFSESDSQENKKINRTAYQVLVDWCRNHSSSSMQFYPLLAPDLPDKHAGAGLARKIGMDEASYRFGWVDYPDGIILSLDADALVEASYFQAVKNEMDAFPASGGCILRYAHPISGTEFPEAVYKAITLYELHLRYYKNALQYSGFPYAYYTIGSCFGVRAGFYVQQGGMNRRKAGEDFYFLNKLFPHRSFLEINSTCVYPSPRPSSRVPFGTGPVIQKIVNTGNMNFLTYNLQAFVALKSFFNLVPELHSMPEEKLKHTIETFPRSLQNFLRNNGFNKKLKEIRKNTASQVTFIKRFFIWFDGFNVIKFLNYSHVEYYPRIDVVEAATELLSVQQEGITDKDPRSLLLFLRKRDYRTKSLSVNW
jgi:hypothetical protein